jgi:hypothetical protein
MYELHTRDPEKWTERAIATTFNMSLCRVKGILKLKELEKQMENEGKVLQNSFQKGMEAMLSATELPLKEDLTQVEPLSLKPIFRLVPEGETFTSEVG